MIDFAQKNVILKMTVGGDIILQDIRHEKIVEILRNRHSVQVTELAKELSTSESTIRRDIIELDRQGRLRKVHGGAVSVDIRIASEETDVSERQQISIEEKESIAQYAASLIKDNDFVYIDAGTTTEKMVDYITNKNATYVTNGVTHAKRLLQKGFEAIMIGGVLRASTEAAIGTIAVENVGRYNFTKCFMGANGVDINKGFSTPDVDEAAIKRAVISQAYESYVLADHTKFGRIASITFACIDEANIITDHIEELDYCKYTTVRAVEE